MPEVMATWTLLITSVALLTNSVLTGRLQNSLEEPKCSRIIDNINNGHVTSKHPPSVTGLWVSSKCEVRPGAEYLLRRYQFFEGGMFELHQYHYEDADCHLPTFALEARGEFRIYQASWIILGATEVDYQPWYVSVMPYTSEVATSLQQMILNETCAAGSISAHAQSSPWQPYERYDVYDYVESDDTSHGGEMGGALDLQAAEMDCLAGLGVTLHELQLMRVEERHQANIAVLRSLLLGDIHTDRHQRMFYRPTGYQEPLTHVETIPDDCSVCRLVSKASEFFPPLLPSRPQHPPSLWLPGTWISERCETRPYGAFVTRRLRFAADDNRTWAAEVRHFSDPLCHHVSYIVRTVGTYQRAIKSAEVGEAYQIDFRVDQIKLEVADRKLVDQLNQSRSCGLSNNLDNADQWHVNIERDVTDTGGCPNIGISVAALHYDVIKVERRRHVTALYVGQRPTDGSDVTLPGRRPTSFQPALVRCSEDTEKGRLRGEYSDEITDNRVEAALPMMSSFARGAHRNSMLHSTIGWLILAVFLCNTVR